MPTANNQVHIRAMPTGLWRDVRIDALKRGISAQDWVVEAIREKLDTLQTDQTDLMENAAPERRNQK